MSPPGIPAIRDQFDAFAEAIVRAHGPERARTILLQAVQLLLQRADALGRGGAARSRRARRPTAVTERGIPLQALPVPLVATGERPMDRAGVGQAETRPARPEDGAIVDDEPVAPFGGDVAKRSTRSEASR